MSGDVFADGEARILDRGFRRYEGPRLRWQPFRTVVVQGLQRGLGFRRRAAAKVLPFLAVGAAFLPTIVMIGLASMLRAGSVFDLELPTYSDYVATISLAVVLLAALAAPEVFGNDQRDGMLGLYLASPLTRIGYLAAKTVAVALILGLITAGPQLLLLIANTVQGVGPDDALDWLVVFLRIVASGVVVSALLTAMSVAITVVSKNRGIATAVIAVVLLVLGGMASGLAEASGTDAWRMLSLFDLFVALPAAIHGDATELSDVLEPGLAWSGLVLWTAVSATVAWVRVQRLEVTR